MLKNKISAVLDKLPLMWRYGTLMFIRGSTIALKFSLSLYIARFVGLSELGTYGLVVALSLTAPVFFRAGLFNTLARSLVDAPPNQMTGDLKHYLAWILGCYGLALLFVPVLLQLTELNSLKNSAYFIWAIVLGEHLATDITLLLNNIRKPRAANIFGLSQAIACVIPFVAISWTIPSFRSLDSILAFWAMGTFVSLAGVSTLFWKWPWRNSEKISQAWYWQRLRSSGYLYCSDLIGTLSQFIDRYMIAFFISIEQAGVYTLFFQLSNAIYTLIGSSIVNTHRPKIISAFNVKNFTQANSQLRKLQVETIFVFILLSTIIGGVFNFIAPLINRPIVLMYMPLMWFTFTATALKAWCLTGFIELYARHYDKELFWLNMFGFLLITAGSIALIQFWGIYGIPTAIGLTYIIVLSLIRITVVKKEARLERLGKK